MNHNHRPPMTYGRARLWLGICGVGSMVTVSFGLLASSVHESWFAAGDAGVVSTLSELGLVFILAVAWLLPFDFLGGYWLPKVYGKSSQNFSTWAFRLLRSLLVLGLLFVFIGLLAIRASMWLGPLGGLALAGLAMAALFVVRGQIPLALTSGSSTTDTEVQHAQEIASGWGLKKYPLIVMEHEDRGFTGGIIGGLRPTIVLPRAWLEFPAEELATAIARRSLVISSGSYLVSLLLAFAWNAAGFSLAIGLTGSDLASVVSLLDVLFAFTLWTFLGLLILPSFSSNASLHVDRKLIQLGVPAGLITRTAMNVEKLQDGEFERPAAIQAVFHPVPSAQSRVQRAADAGWGVWNLARTTLFLSIGCLGLLNRAVHCNVGRPELWWFLPTD